MTDSWYRVILDKVADDAVRQAFQLPAAEVRAEAQEVGIDIDRDTEQLRLMVERALLTFEDGGGEPPTVVQGANDFKRGEVSPITHRRGQVVKRSLSGSARGASPGALPITYGGRYSGRRSSVANDPVSATWRKSLNALTPVRARGGSLAEASINEDYFGAEVELADIFGENIALPGIHWALGPLRVEGYQADGRCRLLRAVVGVKQGYPLGESVLKIVLEDAAGSMETLTLSSDRPSAIVKRGALGGDPQDYRLEISIVSK